MSLSKAKIRRLIEAIKAHVHWLSYVVANDNTLSESELKQFDKYNLPDTSVGLIDNAYTLGMLRMFLKKTEYGELTFEELLKQAESPRTYVEEAAVDQAVTSAANHIKRLAQDIGDRAFSMVNEASNRSVSEATVKDVIRDEIAYGLISRKNYMQVATSLASSLGTDWRRDWRRVAETELVRARTQGQVQAIINKKDIYAYSEGVDSTISILPAQDCCKDCSHHYLGKDGNPKTFKLAELMAAGSNGDEGTSHEKENGLHPGWKTTLPGLHPRCGCRIVYVPVGYGWVNGSLAIVDKEAYKASFRKSLEDLSKAKEYTPFSATAKPMGPASVKAEPAHMPSIPGTDSPAKTAKAGGIKTPKPASPSPAALSTSVKAPNPSKPGDDASGTSNPMVDCPLGVSGCEALGGTGKHHQNSTTLQEHTQIAMQRGGGNGEQAQDPQETLQQDLQIAANWKSNEHPASVVRDHLENGEVAVAKKLDGGITAPQMLTIKGNGKGVFKKSRSQPVNLDMVVQENIQMPIVEGTGIVAENTGHKREVGSYSHAVSYGSKLHPIATYRKHDGAEGSIMSEVKDKEDFKAAKDKLEVQSLRSYCKNEDKPGSFNYAKLAIEKSSDPDHAVEQLSRVIVHDIMTNHTDRHAGNLMHSYDKDGKLDIQCIDNADAFGRGLQQHTNHFFAGMKASGYKVSIPKDLHSKMSARSFGDELRAVGGHVSKKEAAETFLRTKYATHLQNTEGHLNYDHFMSFVKLPGEDKALASPYDHAMFGAKKCSDTQDGGTPDERFNKFKDNYLKEMQNPAHPHHADFAAVTEALNTTDRPAQSPLDRLHAEKADRSKAQENQMDQWNEAQKRMQSDAQRFKDSHATRLRSELGVAKTARAFDSMAQTPRAGKGKSSNSALSLDDPFSTRRTK